MELVYEIITTKDANETDLDIIKRLSEINLFEQQNKLTKDDYYNLIHDKTIQQLMYQFMNNIFNITDKCDINKSILMAYYINGYYNELFPLYMTRLDEKIVKYSKKVVQYMQKIFTNQFIIKNNFYRLIDHYYSLYNLWNSKNVIKSIDKKYEEFTNSLQLLDSDDSIFFINELFDIDIYLSLKVLITNYDKFYNKKSVNDYFWKRLINININDEYRIFIILLAELRKNIISISKNINTKKNLYYNVDIEDILDSIRNRTLTLEHINGIINIINIEINNLCNLNNNCPYINNIIPDIINYMKYAFKIIIKNC